jgi:hypothetical protein
MLPRGLEAKVLNPDIKIYIYRYKGQWVHLTLDSPLGLSHKILDGGIAISAVHWQTMAPVVDQVEANPPWLPRFLGLPYGGQNPT